MSKITIEIRNWDKYNPRKDIKNPNWFAFSNRMIEDADIYELSHGEFRAWIYCLSRASQKARCTAEIDYRHALRISNIEQCDFEKMIKKMGNCISVRDPYADVQTDVRLPVHDKQTNKQTNSSKKTDDFEIPDKIMQTLKTQHMYPENIIAEIARDAWLIFLGTDPRTRKWDRFLTHYFVNEKEKIREKAIELSSQSIEEMSYSDLTKRLFAEADNV